MHKESHVLTLVVLTKTNCAITCRPLYCEKCGKQQASQRAQKGTIAVEFRFCKCGKEVFFEHVDKARENYKVRSLAHTQHQFDGFASYWDIPDVIALELRAKIQVIGRRRIKLVMMI